VVLLIFPGFQSLDLTGPYEAFAGVNAALGASGGPGRPYRIEVVATAAGPVRSESGLAVTAERSIADVSPATVDTLVVVGGAGVHDARRDAAVVDWVRRVGRRSRRVASVCSGSFLLAEAGLLDGRRAATHWARAARLQAEFPSVEVDADAIVVRAGRVWSSAGVTTGIDLGLALVAEDHGMEMAQQVARWLVVFLHRPGGQGQFRAPRWSPPAEDEPIRGAQDLIHAEPGARLTVGELARRCGMSERTFLRSFAREVGCSPARYVEQVRVETARQLLEQTTAGVEHIARRCGFGTAETMRRAFGRRVGVSPAAYRERFQIEREEQRT